MNNLKKFNLILIRHGESIWNKSNRFTGWANIALTNKGIYQAKNLAKELKNNKIRPNFIFTSNLIRAYDTAKIINSQVNSKIIKSWRLNERSYGSLEGLSRSCIKNKYAEQYLLFKNNLSIKPMIDDFPDNNKSESIVDTMNRFKPLWNNQLKQILNNKNNKIMIVSHKNQIRSILLFFKLNPNIEIKNCSSIFINYDKNKFRLIKIF